MKRIGLALFWLLQTCQIEKLQTDWVCEQVAHPTHPPLSYRHGWLSVKNQVYSCQPPSAYLHSLKHLWGHKIWECTSSLFFGTEAKHFITSLYSQALRQNIFYENRTVFLDTETEHIS